MEEQRDPNSSDSSEAESVSPAPSLPSPPILPLQVAQQAHRTTNFFIDNILRPDFGCKKELGLGPRERAHTSGRERVHPAVSRPSLPGTPCQDSNCSTDSSSSSASSTSLTSPKKSSGGGAAADAGSTGSSGLKAEERTGGGAGENTSSSLVVLNGSGAATPESQPLLWPAWVYCTRYSDRPSSGKARVSRRLSGDRERAVCSTSNPRFFLFYFKSCVIFCTAKLWTSKIIHSNLASNKRLVF